MYKLEVYSTRNGKSIRTQTFINEKELDTAIYYLRLSIRYGAKIEYTALKLDYYNDWIVIR